MKERMSRRKKVAVASLLAGGTLMGGVAWGYLTSFGTGSAQATITSTGPTVSGSTWTGQLRPDRLDAITINIHNPLDHAISVTKIPIGMSRQYLVVDDGFHCPVGSVLAGGADVDGNIIPNGDGVNAIADTYTGETVIPAGGDGQFNLWAKFDTLGFTEDDSDNNQDGCLGQTLTLDFPAISYVDAP